MRAIVVKERINFNFEWPSLLCTGTHSEFHYLIDGPIILVICAKCGEKIPNLRQSDVQRACEGKCVYCSDTCQCEAESEARERWNDDQQFHKGLED